MSLIVRCPYCTHRYAVADELADRSVLCPECVGRFRAGEEIIRARPQPSARS